MSALSNDLLVVAILGYALAMLASAAEYAFGNRGAVARVAVRQRELVGAGVGGSATATGTTGCSTGLGGACVALMIFGPLALSSVPMKWNASAPTSTTADASTPPYARVRLPSSALRFGSELACALSAMSANAERPAAGWAKWRRVAMSSASPPEDATS